MLTLLLNIGNTHTQIACAAPPHGDLDLIATIETDKLAAAPARLAEIVSIHGDWQAYSACVVPPLRNSLEIAFPRRFHFITWRDYPWLDFTAYSMETLGADRIANAAAAFETASGSPVVVIDCGTAINTEIIDASGHFLGGIILPGRAMSRQALAEHTAQLPKIALGNDAPLFGTNTADAIRSGINSIIADGLNAHIKKIKNHPGLANCRFLVTGGDADFFIPRLPDAIPAPSNLTLQGIRLALRTSNS